jgi:signal peptidase
MMQSAVSTPQSRRHRGLLFLFSLWLLVAAYAVSAPIAVRLQHGTVVTLVSGSMSPTYPSGSHLIMVPVHDERSIQISDVVTAVTTARLPVTHRIIEKVQLPGGPAFRTKGDANAASDPELIRPQAIIGKIVGRLPMWMQPSLRMQQSDTRLIIFGVPLAFILFVEFQQLVLIRRRT